MSKDMWRIFPKMASILSKYYLVPRDSLFNQVISLGFKTRPKFGELKRISSFCLKHIGQTSMHSPVLLLSSVFLCRHRLKHKVSDWSRARCSSLGICFIVTRLPLDSFQENNQESTCVLCFKASVVSHLYPLYHSPVQHDELWRAFPSLQAMLGIHLIFLSLVDIWDGITQGLTRGCQCCTSLFLLGKHNIYHFCMCVKEKSRKWDSKFILQNAAAFMM